MQSLSCHVKYLCRTCHSKKTTYEQTCFSVFSEFLTRAVLICRLRKHSRLWSYIRATYEALQPDSNLDSEHIFPMHQPCNIWHDSPQCAERPGENIWKWVHAPGQVVCDEPWVAWKTQQGQQVVRTCDCAAAPRPEDGTIPRTRREGRPVLD
jgi:hypothetical protein